MIISCSDFFLPYASDKTKKMGEYLFAIYIFVYLCVTFDSVT
ncbi:conserved domain protein [Bacteroides xylanisolvens SD CC 2a]|nr:conserved domain protein [Bacteroides xylanisolvens SD CC 2a]EFG13120.1 conserved domain protein [Bacteroides xylanisolvens SD CC 1b]